jgi:succinyl-CoA synthetase beta subunit
MKLHEHQANEIFAKYGIPVPEGKVAFSLKEAQQVAEELGIPSGSKSPNTLRRKR